MFRLFVFRLGAAVFPHGHPSPDTRKRDWFLWEDRQPALSSHRAFLSFSEKLFPICFLEFREGMGCFSSWNFHPIKATFQRASPHPIPTTSPFLSTANTGRIAQLGQESGVLPLKHPGASAEVRKVLLLVPLQLVAVTVLNKALTFVS